MLSDYQKKGIIHGVSIATNAPPITHLLFADDSLLFCKANKIEAKAIKDILEAYQRAQCQKVNLDKSEIVFSTGCSDQAKQEVQSQLPLSVSDSITKYLGMPTQLGRSKMLDFNFILDRIRKKLMGWKEKYLSYSGRRTLINIVIQAIPMYTMSCFLLPRGLCEKIEQAICQFWWESKAGQHKIHWVNKDKIHKNKVDGGLGFRELTKQVWRLHLHPHTLQAKCLKAGYYPDKDDVLRASVGYNSIYSWRSIQSAINNINKGSCWRAGNGESIMIWEDSWLPHQNGFKILTQGTGSPSVLKVRDLLEGSPAIWNKDLIDRTFLDFEGITIQQIPLINEDTPDQLMWMYENNDHYTVKSGYRL